MGKCDALKIWKKTLARTSKDCDKCGMIIESGETYFREALKDPRINFIGKSFVAIVIKPTEFHSEVEKNLV